MYKRKKSKNGSVQNEVLDIISKNPGIKGVEVWAKTKRTRATISSCLHSLGKKVKKEKVHIDDGRWCYKYYPAEMSKKVTTTIDYGNLEYKDVVVRIKKLPKDEQEFCFSHLGKISFHTKSLNAVLDSYDLVANLSQSM